MNNNSHIGITESDLRLLAEIVNNISDELILINGEGDIVLANISAVKALGYSPKKIKTKKIIDFFKEKISLPEWKNRYFDELKKTGKPISYQIERVVKKGKKRIVEITAVYMSYKGEDYILSVGRDVTEKITLLQSQQNYDRMNALSLFVSGTAQEIKYPLEVIYQHLQILLEKYGKKDFEYISFKEFEHMMQTITNICNQLRGCRDITNKLLLLNQEQVGIEKSCCDANKIIRGTVNLLSQELQISNVNVSLRLAKKLPFVPLSEVDFSQVLRNIMSNAMQAIPSSGKISIRTAYYKREDKVRLEFKDDGIGIPKENLSRIFDAFFTTRPGRPGHSAGLGLSVVYSIVKGAKGDVSIQSSLRKGTTMKITFPTYKKK